MPRDFDEIGVDRDLDNTDQMSLRPEPPEEFVSLEKGGDAAVTVSMVFRGDAFRQVVNYPVIVEGWKKTKFGRVKRAWEKEFTQAERSTISRYHSKFYRWYLVTGNPDRVMVRPDTLHLLQRAAHFFATV